MNLFERAQQGMNLTAAERGIYQFAQLMLKSLGPLGALPFVAHLFNAVNVWLSTGTWHTFDYLGDLRVLLAAVVASAIAAWQHWQSAQGDAPLQKSVDVTEKESPAFTPRDDVLSKSGETITLSKAPEIATDGTASPQESAPDAVAPASA